MILRDRGCAFPGCNRPPRWCQVHHVTPWSDGGDTNPDNGVLLCSFRHHLIHQADGWQIRIGADGLPEFIPPVHIDPDQTPRRNIYHQRN